MASKKTVTVENLAALGTDRLVGILMALAKDDADIRRRLCLSNRSAPSFTASRWPSSPEIAYVRGVSGG